MKPRSKPKIAIVDEELPFPANSGKRLRTLNLISRLATRYEISYFAHRNSSDAELEEAARHLRDQGITPITVPRTVPPKSGLGFYGRLAGNLFSKLPYSVATHVSAELQSALTEAATEGGYEVWHCEWTPYVQLFRQSRVQPLVVSAHNVESLIWKRYFETESNRLKRWYIKHQWKKFEKFERWAFRRANCTVAVSEEDADLARKDFEAHRVEVVENGVDTQLYSCVDHGRCPNQLIFVGSLDWRPNIDGLGCFLDSVFPAVLQAEPTTELIVVGRNPVRWIQEAANEHPNIRLHANVADVIPFLSAAGLMVVPLRVGGGSRLKILEAAANGLPVVTSRVGVEGLRFGLQHCWIADEIENMAAPIIKAIRNYDACQEMAKAARQRVVDLYDWNALASKLDQVWQRAMNGNN